MGFRANVPPLGACLGTVLRCRGKRGNRNGKEEGAGRMLGELGRDIEALTGRVGNPIIHKVSCRVFTMIRMKCWAAHRVKAIVIWTEW